METNEPILNAESTDAAATRIKFEKGRDTTESVFHPELMMVAPDGTVDFKLTEVDKEIRYLPMPEPSPEAFKFIEEARAAVESLTGTVVKPGQNHPAYLPDPNGNVTPEEFFAEGTLPLADTTPIPVPQPWKADPQDVTALKKILDDVKKFPDIEPIAGLYNQREPAKVDGDRTQMTVAQMSGVVGEVLAQTLTESPSIIDQLIVDSKLTAVYYRIEALEEQNKKIIAALKHLGLNTNKHFR